MRGSYILLVFTGLILSACGNGADHSTTKNQASSSLASSIDNTNIGSRVEFHKIRSELLARDIGYGIYLPDGYNQSGEYSVLFLFYGFGGNEFSLLNGFLSLNLTADKLIASGEIPPLILVVPDYANSFGVSTQREDNPNASGGTIGPYEDYLMLELVPHIDHRYATRKSRDGRYVGGYSMGGFAALHLGFRHSNTFSRIGAFSAALWDYSASDQFIGQRNWLYATPQLRAERDPFLLAQSRDLYNTRIYLDIGRDDALFSVNQRFYQHLLTQGLNVQWYFHAGGHNKDYWSARESDYLRFFGTH